MKSLAVVGYFSAVFFLLQAIINHSAFDALSRKKRLYIFGGCLILPGLGFAPYVLEIAPTTLAIPRLIYWLPFFIIPLAGVSIQMFWPEKEKKLGKPLAAVMLLFLLALNLLPFIIGVVERMCE